MRGVGCVVGKGGLVVNVVGINVGVGDRACKVDGTADGYIGGIGGEVGSQRSRTRRKAGERVEQTILSGFEGGYHARFLPSSKSPGRTSAIVHIVVGIVGKVGRIGVAGVGIASTKGFIVGRGVAYIVAVHQTVVSGNIATILEGVP